MFWRCTEQILEGVPAVDGSRDRDVSLFLCLFTVLCHYNQDELQFYLGAHYESRILSILMSKFMLIIQGYSGGN